MDSGLGICSFEVYLRALHVFAVKRCPPPRGHWFTRILDVDCLGVKVFQIESEHIIFSGIRAIESGVIKFEIYLELYTATVV